MKTFLIALITFTSVLNNTGVETITATYDGKEEGTYYFSDEDELVHSFDRIEDTATASFDLESDKYHGKSFKITFRTETEVNEEDEEYDIHVITKLELIQ